jgi:hypothetical protein
VYAPDLAPVFPATVGEAVGAERLAPLPVRGEAVVGFRVVDFSPTPPGPMDTVWPSITVVTVGAPDPIR